MHAPHWPGPQPNFADLSPMSLRSTSSRDVSAGTSTWCSRPLTVSLNDAMSRCPERVSGDGLGVSEGGLLPVVVEVGRLEVEQLVVLLLLKACRCRLLRPLVAAELALDRPGDVYAAEVLYRVVDHATV